MYDIYIYIYTHIYIQSERALLIVGGGYDEWAP